MSARVVTREDVQAFAELTGDHHPQHVDPEWAAQSQFGQRIAHGMLIASLAVGLVEFDPERVVALRRIRELVFKRPVRLDDAIAVEQARVQSQRIDADTALVTWRFRVVNQHHELVCRMDVEVLAREPVGERA